MRAVRKDRRDVLKRTSTEQFIYSFVRLSVSADNGPGTVLGPRDSAGNKTDTSPHLHADFISGRDGRGQMAFKIWRTSEGL